MSGGHFYPLFKLTKNALIFKIWENRMGLNFCSVFLNPSSKHSLSQPLPGWGRACTILRPRRSPADHLLHWESEAGVDPYPNGDCWVSEKVRVQEERQKETSKYSCFFSSTCSLHIVVENAGIHLCVGRWWHELEFGSVHKNRAVLRTVCVI